MTVSLITFGFAHAVGLTSSGCLSETEYSATVVSHLAEQLDCDLIWKLAEGRIKQCLWLNSGMSLVRPT